MISSLSIDLDNKWAYLKTANHPGWQTWPSYLDRVVPRIRSICEEVDVKLTVFVVGRDLENDVDVQWIRNLAFDGHEIANHSYDHEPWLHLYDENEVRREIARTGQLIQDRLETVPLGFRGPGFSDSPLVHQVLEEQGYWYCASAFPSSVGPLARTFYLMKTGLRRDKDEHKKMFGSMRDMFQPNRPHRLSSGGTANLWMIPVTVQPVTRFPIHFTYLFFLSQFSPSLARWYFRCSLSLCRFLRTPPSLLLHPLDFISAAEEPELSFFPGMKMDLAGKRRQLIWFLSYLNRHFEVLTMADQAAKLLNRELPPIQKKTQSASQVIEGSKEVSQEVFP